MARIFLLDLDHTPLSIAGEGSISGPRPSSPPPSPRLFRGSDTSPAVRSWSSARPGTLPSPHNKVALGRGRAREASALGAAAAGGSPFTKASRTARRTSPWRLRFYERFIFIFIFLFTSLSSLSSAQRLELSSRFPVALPAFGVNDLCL